MSEEVCQRCSEAGNDRRTLWMACFYDMSELGLPFKEVNQDGEFYTLRVCKGCRGEWMAAIQAWFRAVSREGTGTGVFMRRLGSSVELTEQEAAELAVTHNAPLEARGAAASHSKRLLGDWRLKHDTRLRMGLTVFGLTAGAVVKVTQLEPEMGKALVNVDDKTCDWMSLSWLEENFDQLSPNAPVQPPSAKREGRTGTAG